MKLKHLLPFLFLLNVPSKEVFSQFKGEAGLRDVDLKSKYTDIFFRDELILDNFINLRGEIKLKYNDNSVYFIRNGLLNHIYGGNIELDFFDIYYNKSSQDTKTESHKVQDSPIGKISTRTTIRNENRSDDFGIGIKYKSFFIRSEHAFGENNIDGETLIDINGKKDIEKFSLEFDNRSNIYGIGFKHGFFKFIENRQDKDKFNNIFVGVNYSLWDKNVEGELKDDPKTIEKRINFDIYHGKYFSGFININLFEKYRIDFNLSYDNQNKDLKLNLSSSDYSKLHRKDFERNLENRLRVVDRIYDSNLETERNYLRDMFFTDFYSFSIDKEDITFNLNLKNVLLRYSDESLKLGLRYKFAIGTYDINEKEVRVGFFLDGRNK